MRLIDADALILHLTICQQNGMPTSKFYAVDDIIHNVKMMPTIAPEIKTGRWIPVDSYTAFGGDEMTWLAHGNPIAYHYCSECKNHAYALEDGEDLLSDFCPKCGSPMLKEGEGDK